MAVYAITSPIFLTAALIQALLGSRRPSAIPRCVRSIIINAFQSQAIWPLSHIAQERGEVESPFFPNGNTPRSIIAKLWVYGVVASLLSGYPRNIRACFPTIARVAVGCKTCSDHLKVEATAAFARTAAQITGLNYALGPTVAPAEPRRPRRSFNLVHGYPSPEALTGNIDRGFPIAKTELSKISAVSVRTGNKLTRSQFDLQMVGAVRRRGDVTAAPRLRYFTAIAARGLHKCLHM